MNFKLNYLFGLICLLGLVTFTSCEKDEPVLPESTCENFAAEINFGVDSVLVASATNGTDPLTYIWSTGETGNTANITGAGTYTVMVTDASGCEAIASFDINGPGPCTLNVTEITVADTGSGSYTLTPVLTGGTAPFVYSWSSGETTMEISTTTGGTYSVDVTDAEGCVSSQTVFVQGNDPCAFFSVDIYTDSTSTNNLIANTTGGTAPFSYNWSNGATTPSISTPTQSGTYTVTVVDANGCAVTASYTVGSSDPCEFFMIDIQLYQDSSSTDIYLQGVASGGTNPYAYSWSTGEATSNILITNAGTYGVTATDNNGCTATDEYQY